VRARMLVPSRPQPTALVTLRTKRVQAA